LAAERKKILQWNNHSTRWNKNSPVIEELIAEGGNTFIDTSGAESDK